MLKNAILNVVLVGLFGCVVPQADVSGELTNSSVEQELKSSWYECAVDSDCDDGKPCTEGSCIWRKCHYSAIDWCSDPQPEAFCCTPFVPEPPYGDCCVDGDPSTADECTYDGGCFNPPVMLVSAVQQWNCRSAADCDDGNACTDDSCVWGRCRRTEAECCCDDGNPCTYNVCAPGVCIFPPVEGCLCESNCNDAECGAAVNSCGQTEVCGTCPYELVCVGGECVGPIDSAVPVDQQCTTGEQCDDTNSCTDDVCVWGQCRHTWIEACTCDYTCGGAQCGTAVDTCGQAHSCGECPAGLSCVYGKCKGVIALP